MTDQLDEYRRKRDARRTPEPIPRGRPEPSSGGRFVIQQHHARSLHWDVRLERDGVLVSFAVPRGLPRDRERNHLDLARARVAVLVAAVAVVVTAGLSAGLLIAVGVLFGVADAFYRPAASTYQPGRMPRSRSKAVCRTWRANGQTGWRNARAIPTASPRKLRTAS